jgi:hypothetical protein
MTAAERILALSAAKSDTLLQSESQGEAVALTACDQNRREFCPDDHHFEYWTTLRVHSPIFVKQKTLETTKAPVREEAKE